MIEGDFERALFFDVDDFGQFVEVTPDGLAPFIISGIFDTRPPSISPEFRGFKPTSSFGHDMGSAAGAGPRLSCRTSDIASVKPGRGTILVGATFTFDSTGAPVASVPGTGTRYNVFTSIPDATGLSLLTLKQA